MGPRIQSEQYFQFFHLDAQKAERLAGVGLRGSGVSGFRGLGAVGVSGLRGQCLRAAGGFDSAFSII